MKLIISVFLFFLPFFLVWVLKWWFCVLCSRRGSVKMKTLSRKFLSSGKLPTWWITSTRACLASTPRSFRPRTRVWQAYTVETASTCECKLGLSNEVIKSLKKKLDGKNVLGHRAGYRLFSEALCRNLQCLWYYEAEVALPRSFHDLVTWWAYPNNLSPKSQS